MVKLTWSPLLNPDEGDAETDGAAAAGPAASTNPTVAARLPVARARPRRRTPRPKNEPPERALGRELDRRVDSWAAILSPPMGASGDRTLACLLDLVKNFSSPIDHE